MSRLKELIDELCPDGVEYKTLGSMGQFFGGLSGKTKADFGEGYPFVTYMNVFGNAKVNPEMVDYVRVGTGERQNMLRMGDVLFTVSSETPDECGMSSVVTFEPDGPLYLNSFCTGWRPSDDRLMPDYMAYALRSWELRKQIGRTANGVIRFNVSKPLLAGVRVPVPPIEVQREVVRILDSFQELDDALSAEIEAREKQFDACLSKLMKAVSENAPTVKLGSQMTIVRGASPRPIKRYLTTDCDGVHWIKIGDVGIGGKYVTDTAEYVTPDGASKSRLLKRGSLILSNSMSFGRPYILDIDGCIHDGWLAMSDYESSYDRDFLYYLLRSEGVQKAWNMAASTSTVRNLNADIVRDTLVPLPRMDEQIEAVRTLDEMMKLNDLLCAERDAHRKQFEYYRDRLLAFPEKVA